MWEEQERRTQRLRVVVFVLAVSVLLAGWWSSDSRTVQVFGIPLDGLFYDSPRSKPAPTPSAAATPPTVPSTSGRADQPSSVGTTGGSGGAPANPDAGVSPSTQREHSVITVPTERSGDAAKRSAPKERRQAPSPSHPCDSRDDTAQQTTDERTQARGTAPCEDQSHSRGRRVGTGDN